MDVNAIFHFPPGAMVYEWLTSQDHWRRHIESMLGRAGTMSETPRLLDLGCGPGESTFALAQTFPDAREVVGIDASPRMVQRARRRHRRRHRALERVSFEVCDAADLPFEDQRFDLVIGHSFLYLVPNRTGVLAEARRVLRPGGRLLLMEPNAGGTLRRATASLRLPWLATAARRPLSAFRFVASMLLWRFVSGRSGRLGDEQVQSLFRTTGFTEVSTEPVLGGLGLVCGGTRQPAGDG